ncbi:MULTISPECIES: DUF6201 family protein [unclassified Snodgrassella]|nr:MULTISPECIES: DUF6201 family protein [unclassified Snodgrassella]MBI0159154.1 hypothetical protein [Snodgrassella sp. W6238H11]MBI0161340.1 hypothetical protein [Snodgrassella sp. W6238H14]
MKKIIKWIKMIGYFAFFYWLCLFSSSSFYGNFNLDSTVKSEDGEYYANIYKHLPTSPISIMQILGGDKYFIVLYNKKGEELWRVSYFEYISEEALYNMMSFPDKTNNDFICPTNHGFDGHDFSTTIRNHKVVSIK